MKHSKIFITYSYCATLFRFRFKSIWAKCACYHWFFHISWRKVELIIVLKKNHHIRLNYQYNLTAEQVCFIIHLCLRVRKIKRNNVWVSRSHTLSIKSPLMSEMDLEIQKYCYPFLHWKVLVLSCFKYTEI